MTRRSLRRVQRAQAAEGGRTLRVLFDGWERRPPFQGRYDLACRGPHADLVHVVELRELAPAKILDAAAWPDDTRRLAAGSGLGLNRGPMPGRSTTPGVAEHGSLEARILHRTEAPPVHDGAETTAGCEAGSGAQRYRALQPGQDRPASKVSEP